MSKYLSGKNSVLEAIQNELPLKKIFATRNIKFDANGIEVEYKTSHELDKMVRTNHQGLVAELKEFNYYNIDEVLKDKPEKVLVLDHIQDPHNFGAIMRSANAAGVKHIIIPKDRAVKVTPTVLRISSGGYIGLKIIRVDSLQNVVKKLKDNEYWIYATTLDKSAVDYKYVSFNKPMVLIVGNEAKGISKTLLNLADEKVYINMEGTVQSLNVSVATGIMLFKI